MKVLHVIPGLDAGHGGPTYALRGMTLALADAGCEVDVITTSSEMSETGSGIPQHVDGVRIFSFERRPSLGWSFSWPLTRWMLRHLTDYDLLHVHALFAYPTLASCTAARHHAIPYVLRPLGTLNPWELSFRSWKKAPYLKLIEYRNLAGAAAIHATSALEETSIRALGLPVHVVTIPLGVDIPERPVGADFRRDGDFINVLYLSRLHPKKGLEPLIDAVAALGSPVPYRLIVAGDGDPQFVRYLQDLVEHRGVGDRVQFAGFVSDAAKQQVLSEADLFVLPSYSENFGVAVAEAMAAAVPVIVGDRVGLAAAVEQAGAGLVVPARGRELAEALRVLLVDPERRRRMGAAGRAYAERELAWPRIAKSLTGLYEEVVRARPG